MSSLCIKLLIIYHALGQQNLYSSWPVSDNQKHQSLVLHPPTDLDLFPNVRGTELSTAMRPLAEVIDTYRDSTEKTIQTLKYQSTFCVIINYYINQIFISQIIIDVQLIILKYACSSYLKDNLARNQYCRKYITLK